MQVLTTIHVISEIFCILFSKLCLKPDVYFTLTAHLNSDPPPFKCSVATCGWWHRVGQLGLNSLECSRYYKRGSDADMLFSDSNRLYPYNVHSEVYRQQSEVSSDTWIVIVIESANHCRNFWVEANVITAWRAYKRHTEKLLWIPECAHFSDPADYLNFPVGSYYFSDMSPHQQSLFGGLDGHGV